jgi:SAM-dependent methyltransferase
MALRRSLLCTALLVGIAAAQPAEPRRAPDVPYVPTSVEAVQAMLKLADVQRTDLVYDLGCGDGRIVIAAARNFGARGVGIDIDPQRIAEAKENARRAGVEERVRFEQGDLFDADFHEATVVTLFLMSTLNQKLRPKLMKDLRPGTRIVSNTFDMGDWTPEKTFTVGNPQVTAFLSHRLFLWVVPPRDKK